MFFVWSQIDINVACASWAANCLIARNYRAGSIKKITINNRNWSVVNGYASLIAHCFCSPINNTFIHHLLRIEILNAQLQSTCRRESNKSALIWVMLPWVMAANRKAHQRTCSAAKRHRYHIYHYIVPPMDFMVMEIRLCVWIAEMSLSRSTSLCRNNEQQSNYECVQEAAMHIRMLTCSAVKWTCVDGRLSTIARKKQNEKRETCHIRHDGFLTSKSVTKNELKQNSISAKHIFPFWRKLNNLINLRRRK